MRDDAVVRAFGVGWGISLLEGIHGRMGTLATRLRGVNRTLTDLSTGLEAVAEDYFRRYAYPEHLRTHSRLVGRIALVLAEARAEHGDDVDVRATALAGYLHDIGRSLLLRGDGREHNELSALVLAAEGLAECVEPARRHPVYAVLDERIAPRTLAERVVYLADRRGGMTVLPIDQRISETAHRHPQYAEPIERARPLAREIEREVFEGLPFRPDQLAERIR